MHESWGLATILSTTKTQKLFNLIADLRKTAATSHIHIHLSRTIKITFLYSANNFHWKNDGQGVETGDRQRQREREREWKKFERKSFAAAGVEANQNQTHICMRIRTHSVNFNTHYSHQQIASNDENVDDDQMELYKFRQFFLLHLLLLSLLRQGLRVLFDVVQAVAVTTVATCTLAPPHAHATHIYCFPCFQ